MRTFAVVMALSSIGCGAVPPSQTGALEQADSAVPVLTFTADFRVTQSAPLIAGQKAILRYDPARLPRCRATYNGLPAWAIQASWSADGGRVENAATMSIQAGGFVPADVELMVPFGRDLAVWFLNADDHDCREWDSDYGRNFHFAIEPSPYPVVHFRSDWSVSVDGKLHAGAPVVIDYDLTRLPSCRQDYNGYQTWDVAAHARFDGGVIVDASLTRSKSDYERVQAPATIATPAGAHVMELWFDSSDRTGCHTWDSDYGRNFRLALD